MSNQSFNRFLCLFLRKPIFSFPLFIGCVLLSAILLSTQLPDTPKEANPLLNELSLWMEGSFSSLAQARADSNYLNVNLEVRQIWKEDSLAVWLYVEQAAAFAPDKPFLQRIYRLNQTGKKLITNQVFKIPKARAFIGAYLNPWKFDRLSQDSLIPLGGCSMDLTYKKGKFVGNISENQCENSWGGASYVTSELTVSESKLISLNQGWNGDGEQVWGPKEGGYIFEKRQ